MFDHGTDDAGGSFGAQRDGAVAAVFEGVGFLVNDVAGLTDAAVKELGVFEDGRADFAEVVKRGQIAGDGLDGLPFPTIRRQRVGGAARGVDFGCGGSFIALGWRLLGVGGDGKWDIKSCRWV